MRFGAVLLSVLTFVGLLAPLSAAQEARQRPRVTGAVQVTQNPAWVRAHSSPQIAVHPGTGELVVVETDIRGDLRCAVHISTDQGQSWFAGGEVAMAPYTECSREPLNGPYATLAFGNDGVLYVAFMANSEELAGADYNPVHIFLARSTDAGRTFQTGFVFEAPDDPEADQGANARPMVSVDPSDSDNVYVGWMQRHSDAPHGALLAASTDGGRTFGEPTDLATDLGGYQARPAVGPDGTLYAAYHSGCSDEELSCFEVVRPIFARSSSDHGQTFTDNVEVDQGNASFFAARKLVTAVGPDGTLYAVWYGAEDPVMDPTEDRTDIYLRRSEDGGQTWSDRVIVNDDTDVDGRINHYDPGIAVAPDGRVDIAWYDFRNSPYPERFPDEFAAPFNHDGFQDVYYTWSDDGGRTFAPNVRVTDRIINREIGVWSNNVHSHMSVGIASSNQATYLAWQDTRNGNELNDAEDVYFASVRHTAATAAVAGGASPWLMIGLVAGALLLGVGVALLVSMRVVGRSAPTSAPAAAPVKT